MIFYGYPSHPHEVGKVIEASLIDIRKHGQNIYSWKAIDIAGSFIRDKIQEHIDKCDLFIADITYLNFNVVYEVGYAIALKKPVLLTKNSTLVEKAPFVRDIGIFDTIGYSEYKNSSELFEIIRRGSSNILYNTNPSANRKNPVFLLETKHKTDYSIRISSRIKKTKLRFKIFDPSETPRLNVYDSIQFVSQAIGVVIQLLPNNIEDAEINNIRASFLAGLADGMGKILYLLQYDESPVPLDYRDIVKIFKTVNDIDGLISDFAEIIVEKLQDGSEQIVTSQTSKLEDLDLGSSAAENEMQTLQSYYLPTESFEIVRRGNAQLVVGRKGAGKSAIFIQVRDKERSSIKNLVLDLMPDGYQLIKFRERVLDKLKDGSFMHTITAFWEYVLLLEICNKIISNDKQLHKVDMNLSKRYSVLEEKYSMRKFVKEGDFSERLNFLIDNFSSKFSKQITDSEDVTLSAEQLTNMLYMHDISDLRLQLSEYLKYKNKIWILFDNIDKGWPSTGLETADLLIIRTLIDAARQLQRHFQKNTIDVHPVIFLRNDVYELLVLNTSDRQKESKVVLDWTDSDLLKELLRLRIATSLNADSKATFENLWSEICVSHYNGEETSDFFVERCLMRPRFLINFITQCKSYAVNFKHTKIQKEDITKGFESFSYDLLTDIGYEIQDIHPEANNILYSFIGAPAEMNYGDLKRRIAPSPGQESQASKLIDTLLWYGFIGVKNNGEQPAYIYNYRYNMMTFKGVIKLQEENLLFAINPAFWPALHIRC